MQSISGDSAWQSIAFMCHADVNIKSNTCWIDIAIKNKQKWTPVRALLSVLTSSQLSSPCVVLTSLSSPVFSTLYPSQSQLWCMHEGGFPEDQRGHYPGAIRPLVEHVNECWVLLCFHMQPLYVWVG